MTAANDNGRACTPRNAATDIAALLRSGHVEAGGALPLTQRVQTSGRGDPQPPRWSAEGERAQRILGRAWSEGGEARRCALALWLAHGEGERSLIDPLLVAAALYLTEPERLEMARSWAKWGTGKGADRLALRGIELAGLSVGWYEVASEEPGGAGWLSELRREADAAIGAVRRMREEHARALAAAKVAAKKGRAA